MRVKRFLAASLQDAKEQIKRELGEDAIVLSSRQVKKRGLWGWFGLSQVEVTAAIDEPLAPVSLPAVTMVAATAPEVVPPWASLQQDLLETKKILAVMSQRIQQPAGQPLFPEGLAAYQARLQSIGITRNLLEDLCQEIATRLTPVEMEQEQLVEKAAQEAIAARMTAYAPAAAATKQRIICVVGPTGVGKTTTIAKLAARAALQQKQRVALVTFDTYRIAAVDQLRTYGEILGAPVEVVLTPGEMRKTLAKLETYDVIFVDSVGRSQHNVMQLSELKAFLEAVGADEVLLALSATTQYEVMSDIVANYQVAKPSALIFTKLDEARAKGPIVNLLLTTDLPVAYLTNGQAVPEDLLQPTVPDLMQLLLEERRP